MDTDTKIDLVLRELKNICVQIDEKFDRKLDGLSLEVGALHRTFQSR